MPGVSKNNPLISAANQLAQVRQAARGSPPITTPASPAKAPAPQPAAGNKASGKGSTGPGPIEPGSNMPDPIVATTNGQGKGLPNRRQYNPLSDFSSYNYQITLYLVTPEASNRFVMSGMTQTGNAVDASGKQSDGFYIIAQSGGINNGSANVPGGNKRADGFDLDFYIDDLKFKTYTTTKASGSSSAASAEFEFNIYEPYGLSFTSKITAAAKRIQSESTLPGFSGTDNALAQFYVLGIRFYGYDKNGEILTADKYQGADKNNKSDNQALFERFYSIKIKSFKFRLDGKMPVYNITAACLSISEAFGAKRAQLASNSTLTGSTVQEMLTGKNGMLTKLNKDEFDSAEKRKKEAQKAKKKDAVILANQYAIKFEPNSGIEDALMVDPKDFAKYKLNIAMGDVSNTKDSNAGSEGKSSTNKGKKTLTLTSGTHIVAAIEQVIKQSSYVKDMMTQVQSALAEDAPADNGNPVEVAWFSVTPGIEILGFDSMLSDYAYKITYYIQKYAVPYVRTALVSKTSAYPGPHKKYEYWYTGKNTEVISYEQQYNNLYFLTGVGASPNESSPSVPKVDKPQPGNQTGSQNKAAEAVNALAVDLYDPGSQVNSKMTILGDPDYLSQTIGSSLDSVFDKFYGPDGYTINPNGGQVFIELDFKTAVDYNSGTDPTTPAGTLSINDKIRFYAYDESVQDAIKGITFELKWLTSTFSKGKFTQELEMYPTNLSQFARKKDASSNKDKSNRAESKDKGKRTTLDAQKARDARKEFAFNDPRRIDTPAKVMPRPTWSPMQANVWDRDYGKNYNPDGTPNEAFIKASRQPKDDDNSQSGNKSKTDGQRETPKVVGRGGSRTYSNR